jgi:hypothetical protein
MLSVINLSVVTSPIMLSVIMLSVVAPLEHLLILPAANVIKLFTAVITSLSA